MSGYAIAAVLGAVFGSFCGVLIVRVPSGASVIGGRSHCDACGATLSASELIPIVSWVVLRGRCRSCGARVPALWTIIEVAVACMFVLAVGLTPDLGTAAIVGPFAAILLTLTIIDLRTYRLPDAIVVPTIAIAALVIAGADSAGFAVDLRHAAVGAAAFGGFLGAIYLLARRVYGREAMGFGDVKFAFLIGLVVGAIDLPSVAVAAGAAILIGGLAGLVALARGAAGRSTLPYGPMLAAGALLALGAGRSILDAYLSMYR